LIYSRLHSKTVIQMISHKYLIFLIKIVPILLLILVLLSNVARAEGEAGASEPKLSDLSGRHVDCKAEWERFWPKVRAGDKLTLYSLAKIMLYFNLIPPGWEPGKPGRAVFSSSILSIFAHSSSAYVKGEDKPRKILGVGTAAIIGRLPVPLSAPKIASCFSNSSNTSSCVRWAVRDKIILDIKTLVRTLDKLSNDNNVPSHCVN